MRHLPYTKAMLIGVLGTWLLTMGSSPTTAQTASPEALTPMQAMACIQTAAGAQSGLITKVEANKKGEQLLCEVKIVDQEGKKYDVNIDVTTKEVIKAK
jgi:uncharacterized membrane protein YkoI